MVERVLGKDEVSGSIPLIGSRGLNLDKPSQSAARLKLAEGLFTTVRLGPEASEYETRNALSRCYYAFFHVSHVLLGRYRGHGLISSEVGKKDDVLGEFIATLQALRIEADYIPDVVDTKFDGELGAYRLRAGQVVAEAKTEFARALKLARRNLYRRRRA